jgi:two-component system, NarL family, sensor kinase
MRSKYPGRLPALILLFLFSAGFFVDSLAGKSDNTRIRNVKDSIARYESIVSANKILNNDLAVLYAQKALDLARTLNNPSMIVRVYNLKGMVNMLKHEDSSYFYFSTALKMAEIGKLWPEKIRILYNLSNLYSFALNYQTALTFMDSARRIAENVKDWAALSNAYNSMGNYYYDLKDFSNARKMYDKALSIAQTHSLSPQIGVATGSLSKFETDSYKAVVIMRKALTYLKNIHGAEEERARLLNNIGEALNNPDSAIRYYSMALQQGIQGNLPEVIMIAYNNMAYSYLEKGDTRDAEFNLKEKAIPLAQKVGNNGWLAELYDTYADVLKAKGEFQQAYHYQKDAYTARAESENQIAASQVRLQAIFLDVKDKELRIQKEERELLVQSNRLQRTEFWLVITILLVVLSLTSMLWLQQRSRMRLQNEQISSARRIIDMEESEKGRTARELHDITGQLVLGITGEIENLEMEDEMTRELLVERIKSLGQSIRHISHRMNPAMVGHFSFNELISGLCEDMERLIGIRIVVEQPESYPDLAEEIILHVYRIAQELITNAGKYAMESLVTLTIFTDENQLYVNYMDTGNGFVYDEKNVQGMGLMNIFERVKLLGGKARLITSPGNGTRWEMSFTLNRKTK